MSLRVKNDESLMALKLGHLEKRVETLERQMILQQNAAIANQTDLLGIINTLIAKKDGYPIGVQQTDKEKTINNGQMTKYITRGQHTDIVNCQEENNKSSDTQSNGVQVHTALSTVQRRRLVGI